MPGDNSVDLFTNDIGVVVVMGADGQHEGYNLVVGGGLGRTHRNKDTFARMGEPIGYVDKVCFLHALLDMVNCRLLLYAKTGECRDRNTHAVWEL